jgi:hypothetical protein
MDVTNDMTLSIRSSELQNDVIDELMLLVNWDASWIDVHSALPLLRVCRCAMHSRRSWPAGITPSWDVWLRNESGGSDEY